MGYSRINRDNQIQILNYGCGDSEIPKMMLKIDDIFKFTQFKRRRTLLQTEKLYPVYH